MRHVLSRLASCSSTSRVFGPHSVLGGEILPTCFLRAGRFKLFNSRPVSSFSMSEDAILRQSNGSDEDEHLNPQAGGATGGSRKPIKHQNQKGLKKKRDTHFLCFPLVTDTSVPQLAESLRYFRAMTTKPKHNKKGDNTKDEHEEIASGEVAIHSQPEPDIAIIEDDGDRLTLNTNHSQSLSPSNPELQILPAIAHRPPGTFHLTLGVMDLSTKEEMDRALKLLQELDYAEMFRDVMAQSSGSEASHKSNRHDEAQNQEESETATSEKNEADLQSLKRPISPPPLKSNTTNGPQKGFSTNNLPQINLTGISTFPAAKTSRVFFAKPYPATPFPLQQFAQAIRLKFRQAGFITETRPLVLHATVANMRYATQARGGRTSKGKTWRYGKDRWTDGQVDAREIIRCFDQYAGNVEEYVNGIAYTDGETHEYIWAKDIDFNRVAICKMGAEKSDDEVLVQVYPPVGEKLIFS